MMKNNLHASGLVEVAELDALLAPTEDDPAGLGTPSIATGFLSAASAFSAAFGDGCPTTACTSTCGS